MQGYCGGRQIDAAMIVSHQQNCIADVSDWCAAEWLHLNADKTELLWLGSASQLHRLPSDISITIDRSVVEPVLLFVTLVYSTQNCRCRSVSYAWCKRAFSSAFAFCSSTTWTWHHIKTGVTLSTTAVPFSRVFLPRHWHLCEVSCMWQQERCSTSNYMTTWLLLCMSCIGYLLPWGLTTNMFTRHDSVTCLLMLQTYLCPLPKFQDDRHYVHQLILTLLCHEQVIGLVTPFYHCITCGTDFQQNLNSCVGVNLSHFCFHNHMMCNCVWRLTL